MEKESRRGAASVGYRRGTGRARVRRSDSTSTPQSILPVQLRMFQTSHCRGLPMIPFLYKGLPSRRARSKYVAPDAGPWIC